MQHDVLKVQISVDVTRAMQSLQRPQHLPQQRQCGAPVLRMRTHPELRRAERLRQRLLACPPPHLSDTCGDDGSGAAVAQVEKLVRG